MMRFWSITLLAALTTFSHAYANVDFPARGFDGEVIYQVLLDRFEDGLSENNVLVGDDPRIYDPTQANPYARFGGDIDGLIHRLPYIADLGATAIWLSPFFQNTNVLLPLDPGKPKSSLISNYHGYWIEDWYAVDGHLQMEGEIGFGAIDRLVQAANQYDLKIIADTVLNHTSNYDLSCGKIYKRGELITDCRKDLAQKDPSKRWYHHRGGMPLETDPNIVSLFPSERIYTHRLANLADLNTDTNPEVRNYLLDAHLELLEAGVWGFRVDTVAYVHPPVLKWFEQNLRAQFPSTPVVGEWFAGGPSRRKSMGYFNHTTSSMFNFDFRWDFEKGFVKDESYGYRTFNHFLDVTVPSMKQMRKDGTEPNDLVTFVDNHDLPRLRDMGATQEGMEAAIAMLMALPGTPTLYYGIEQDLFDGTGRRGVANLIGGDPYNRSMMAFSRNEAFKERIKTLINLRRRYEVFHHGDLSLPEKSVRRYHVSSPQKKGFRWPRLNRCARDQLLVLERNQERDVGLYAVNISDERCGLQVRMDDLLTIDEQIVSYPTGVTWQEETLETVLEPFAYLLIKGTRKK